MEKKLLKFYANWCGPCVVMKPVAEKIAKEHELELVEVNIDTEKDLASEYGVTSIPTLVLLEDGKEVARYSGAQTQTRVSSALGLTT